ncbi:substrate-binding domain-containing protein [Solirubrobacter ginsenosidimutans]|uniref:Substrate-binding domain-containing protein n=1 Tax=Solirubrobacter ginsenosidimutans TaxID=490573 RepID=A0A9X3MQ40_9ACTN|nr:substrate-binding domain-containing protein [Solirubrobacter ginsenosidimutans]MDA0160240.1 substrate-binding domain-containing protein [Solirubrobacter ginsenosidimutans]
MKRFLLIALLLVAGCGGTEIVREPGVEVSGAPTAAPLQGAPVPDGAVRIAVVTHGPASSKFWAIIRNGVDSAARRLDVLVDYKSPDVFSVERMSELIDQAVATKPDGLVVSIPAPGLAPAIRRAVDAGIPVISINSGSDVFRSLGVLVHVGQVEDRAGLEAGRRLADAGVRQALCVNQERDNTGTDARCAGLAKAMREVGGRSRVLHIDDEDPRTPSEIATAVAADGVDGVLATNSIGGLAAAQGVAGQPVKVGTFDLGPDVLKAVEAGKLLFAVDQQPYLQGYLPIEMLALRARYGILPAQHDVVATGPNFVTRDNAAQALELSERSIR